MPKSKRLHFKDIDTLRFFALVPVILYCSFHLTLTENEGVHYEMTRLFAYLKQNSLDFFFFISAFLLTSHALREYKYTQQFSLRDYFVRRLFRLGPLLFFGLLFAFLVHPWILGILKLNHIESPSPFGYLLLIPNYLQKAAPEQYVYLAVIWTIFMFVQFYLVWGIVLRFFKANLNTVAVICIAIGIADRIVHHFTAVSFEFDTLAYGAPVGMGTLLARLVREDSPYLKKIATLPKRLVFPSYLVGLVIVLGAYLVSPNFIYAGFVPVITCFFFGCIIIDQTFGKNTPVKFRNNKFFSHLGQISFGIIVYQSMIGVMMVIGIDSLDFEIASATVKIAFTLVSFVLAWIAADISYNFIEKPLLRLRREFKKA